MDANCSKIRSFIRIVPEIYYILYIFTWVLHVLPYDLLLCRCGREARRQGAGHGSEDVLDRPSKTSTIQLVKQPAFGFQKLVKTFKEKNINHGLTAQFVKTKTPMVFFGSQETTASAERRSTAGCGPGISRSTESWDRRSVGENLFRSLEPKTVVVLVHFGNVTIMFIHFVGNLEPCHVVVEEPWPTCTKCFARAWMFSVFLQQLVRRPRTISTVLGAPLGPTPARRSSSSIKNCWSSNLIVLGGKKGIIRGSPGVSIWRQFSLENTLWKWFPPLNTTPA